jgi:DNA (cytosine-5)-methyltransferase 1
MAGFRVLGAIDSDDLAVQTYKNNHPRVRLWNLDICKITASRVMRELDLVRGELDLLAGCPPCQGFSVLRTRNGALRNRDRRNRLVSEMLRFARVLRPRAIMLENVPGLVAHRPFRELCRALRRLGHSIRWEIRDAAQYGVPQRRKRLILLAGRGFEVPFAAVCSTSRTVRQAIGRLPKVGQSCDALHNMPQNRSEKVLELIRSIPKNGGSRQDLPERHQLRCHKHFDGFNDVYGRMSWNGPAPTITSGCFNPSKGRFLHPQQNRAISLREAAMLQTFPASYWFPVVAGKEAISLMIGNALPPEFVKHHALEIIKSLKSR